MFFQSYIKDELEKSFQAQNVRCRLKIYYNKHIFEIKGSSIGL